jgi:predicted TPR repeat methyltransferase
MNEATARIFARSGAGAPSSAEGAEAAPPLPRILHGVDAAQAQARIDIWRADDQGFDALIRGGAPAPIALRRLALAHWSAGNPRLAAIMLATAVATAPERGEMWLDLGGALRAIREPAQARIAFERSLALDPQPARAWLALALNCNELNDRAGAESAFKEALARDPKLGEAAFGFALVAFDERRYIDAAERFAKAIALNSGGAFARLGLGQSQFFLGHFAEAAENLALAIAAGAGEPALLQRAALARYLAVALEGDLAEAERLYLLIAGQHGEALEAVARSAFRVLAGYGYREAALKIAHARLADGEGDPENRYLVAAVAGEKLERAPADYLVAHFDAFADVFDAQLVGVLGYHPPDDLMDMIDNTGRRFVRALDLGCGTGLAGRRLREGRARLVGVDLSPRMLNKAAERGVYDELIEADILTFLRGVKQRFDLVLAADTLVYFGDLKPFFAAAARATEPGALLALNVETAEGLPYRVLPSGRFAHDPEALAEMAAPWFKIKALRRTILRAEADRKVEGALAIIERRGLRARSSNAIREGLAIRAA